MYKYRVKSNYIPLLYISRAYFLIILSYLIFNLYPTYIIILFGIFFTGWALRNLEIAIHQATHQTLFRYAVSDWIQDILVGYIILDTISGYRKHHVKHHAYTLENSDPIWEDYRWFYFSNKNSKENKLTRLLKTIFYPVFMHFDSIQYHIKSRCIGYVLFNSAFYIILIFFDLSYFLAIWIPALFIYGYIVLFSEYADHYKVFDSHISKSRTNYGIIWSIFFPWNEGFHSIHHLDVKIPNHLLKFAYMEVKKQFGNIFIESHSPKELLLETLKE